MNQNDYNTILSRLSSGESMDSILESISQAASAAEKEYKSIQKKKEAEEKIAKERAEKLKKQKEEKHAAVEKIIEAINDYSKICGHTTIVPTDKFNEDLLDLYASAIERSILMVELFS